MKYRNTIAFDDRGKLVTTADAKPNELWFALLHFFRQRRPVKTSVRWETTYPETTNDDVRQLTDLWTKAHDRKFANDPTEAMRGAPWRWARILIEASLVAGDPNKPFRRNEEFWFDWTLPHAAQMASLHGATRSELIRTAIGDHIEKLPGRVSRGAKVIAKALPEAARMSGGLVGGSLRGIFGGLFSGLGVPLLIGAAVVVGGVVVVPRLLAKRTPATMMLPAGKQAPP